MLKNIIAKYCAWWHGRWAFATRCAACLTLRHARLVYWQNDSLPNKTYNTQTMIATWFDSKLKDQTQGLAAIPEVCIDHSASTIQALQPSVGYALPPIQATAGGGLEWLFKPADRLRHALTQQLPAQLATTATRRHTLISAFNPHHHFPYPHWHTAVTYKH